MTKTVGNSYTKEQAELADKVLRATKNGDSYAALDLPTNATEVGIRKAYRALALKLHPDKNKAHSAEEAYKALASTYVELLKNFSPVTPLAPAKGERRSRPQFRRPQDPLYYYPKAHSLRRRANPSPPEAE